RLLLLVRIELRGPPTAWVIVQPRHLLRLPPLQPLAHPIPIDLVDVGNLFQRVPALTEQHRVRAHARALGGGGFHNRAQLPALFGREGLHKFRRGFHTHYSTAELIPRCLSKGIRIPNGFAVTAAGYRHVLQVGGLAQEIRTILADLDTQDLANLAERGRRVREAILATPLPDDLQQEISAAYITLCAEYGSETDVAVRSSATAEDLPDASFAGQQESFLNIRRARAVLDACRQCLGSLFTDRAISYRVDRGFDHFAVALSIGVQKMVRADLGAGGVLFTLDTESGFRDVVLINSAYGLGESVVKGRVDPDEFLVFKPTLRQGLCPILKRAVGAKQEKLIYATRGGRSTRMVPVPTEERERLSLSDDDVLTLARWGCLIEDHYSAKAGRPMPMDIEWAKDGNTGELFILQARPETVHALARKATLDTYRLQERGTVLLTGKSVSEKIGAGPVRVIK